MIKNICGIIFSIGVIGFTIYYINNNVKEGWVGNTNEEYILLKLDTIGGDGNVEYVQLQNNGYNNELKQDSTIDWQKEEKLRIEKYGLMKKYKVYLNDKKNLNSIINDLKTNNKRIIIDKGNTDYIYINEKNKIKGKWVSFLEKLNNKKNVNYRNDLWDYIKLQGNYDFLYNDDNNVGDNNVGFNDFIKDNWKWNYINNVNTIFTITDLSKKTYQNNDKGKKSILQVYENGIIKEDTKVEWTNEKLKDRKFHQDVSKNKKNLNHYSLNNNPSPDNKALYDYIKEEVKKKLEEGNGKYYYIIEKKPDDYRSIKSKENYNFYGKEDKIRNKLDTMIKAGKKDIFFIKSPYEKMNKIEYNYLFGSNSKWIDYENSVPGVNKWIVKYEGENTQDDNIKKIWKHLFIDEHKKTWMYNIEGMKTIEGMETIHDIEHPYYGYYYDNDENSHAKNKCLKQPSKGNVGECNITKEGIYKNGKICQFIPSLWGFKEKNICLPIDCSGNYNPHKMCKGKYDALSNISDCFEKNDCSENTLTYDLSDKWNKKQKYKKKFYVDGKATTKNTTKKGTCKCMCKPGYYGNTCNLKKKTLEEVCSNDNECESGNCAKKNERDPKGLCKKTTFETQKEKNDKIEEENMKKTSFLNIMLGLVIFVFVLLIISYFFYSIKKSVKNKTDIFLQGYNNVLKKSKLI